MKILLKEKQELKWHKLFVKICFKHIPPQAYFQVTKIYSKQFESKEIWKALSQRKVNKTEWGWSMDRLIFVPQSLINIPVGQINSNILMHISDYNWFWINNFQWPCPKYRNIYTISNRQFQLYQENEHHFWASLTFLDGDKEMLGQVSTRWLHNPSLSYINVNLHFKMKEVRKSQIDRYHKIQSKSNMNKFQTFRHYHYIYILKFYCKFIVPQNIKTSSSLIYPYII